MHAPSTTPPTTPIATCSLTDRSYTRDGRRRDDVIEVVARLTHASIHRSARDVKHLAGGNIMELPPLCDITSKATVQLSSTVAEQRRGCVFDRAVGVHFDEDPFGPAFDVDALVDPALDARCGRRIVAG